MTGREGLTGALVLLWLVYKPKLNWIYLELQRELIHGAFQCVKTGYRARSPHGSGCANIAACEPSSNEYVWARVEEGRSFTATLVVVVLDRGVVDVILHDGGKLAARLRAKLNLLIDRGTMTDALKHHGAAYDELDRTFEIAGACCGQQRVWPRP